jgi:hypothetical protein
VKEFRDADDVIAGRFSADEANAPGMLPHLAELASKDYHRALRPPRELIVHPAFAQIARRFQFIQMTHQEARAHGAGATDLKILGQRLRWLQGDPGEFAITLLWPRVKTKGPRPCSGRGPSIRTKTDCGRIRSSSRQWQHQGRQE